MTVGRRYLIRQTSGDLVELSPRVFDLADDRVAPIADLAGRCVEMVSVIVVKSRDLHPVVSDVAFTKVYFDAEGFVDGSKRDLMIRLMLESCADRMPRRTAKPANDESAPSRARGRLDREFAWKPDPGLLTQVLHRFDFRVSDGLERRLLAMGRVIH